MAIICNCGLFVVKVIDEDDDDVEADVCKDRNKFLGIENNPFNGIFILLWLNNKRIEYKKLTKLFKNLTLK